MFMEDMVQQEEYKYTRPAVAFSANTTLIKKIQKVHYMQLYDCLNILK